MVDPQWRQFESAVAAFVAALDPTATVKHDVRLPDRHTQRPRQRDVWVETRLWQHYPLRVLISCKRWRRKINQSHIDAFSGECQSAGAHVGVVYAFGGYTKPALEKAEQLGISCCRLYLNEPPELPERLTFYSYCCRPSFSVKVVASPHDVDVKLTYSDIFENEINTQAGSVKVVDALAEMISAAEEESVRGISTSDPFPSDCGRQLVLGPKQASEELKLQVFVIWDYYRGKLEAHLLSGSYNFGTGQFAGSQTGPPIDTRGSHPGPGWELLKQRPSRTSCRTVVGILRSSLHGTRTALIDQLATRVIR